MEQKSALKLRQDIVATVRRRYSPDGFAKDFPEAVEAALKSYKAAVKESKSKTREEPQQTGFDRQEPESGDNGE